MSCFFSARPPQLCPPTSDSWRRHRRRRWWRWWWRQLCQFFGVRPTLRLQVRTSHSPNGCCVHVGRKDCRTIPARRHEELQVACYDCIHHVGCSAARREQHDTTRLSVGSTDPADRARPRPSPGTSTPPRATRPVAVRRADAVHPPSTSSSQLASCRHRRTMSGTRWRNELRTPADHMTIRAVLGGTGTRSIEHLVEPPALQLKTNK